MSRVADRCVRQGIARHVRASESAARLSLSGRVISPRFGVARRQDLRRAVRKRELASTATRLARLFECNSQAGAIGIGRTRYLMPAPVRALARGPHLDRSEMVAVLFGRFVLERHRLSCRQGSVAGHEDGREVGPAPTRGVRGVDHAPALVGLPRPYHPARSHGLSIAPSLSAHAAERSSFGSPSRGRPSGHQFVACSCPASLTTT